MAQRTPGSNVAVKPKREHTARNVRRSSMKVSRLKLKKEQKLKMTAGHYSQTESPDGNSFRIATVNALFQLVSDQELSTLLELMREFYSQQQMRFDEPAASRAVTSALNDPGLAQIYLIFRGQELAGYFALTFCFSLEFHGRFALLDELYLREPFRRQKLGKAVVAFAEDLCKKAGIEALRLEVGRENQPAQSLYRTAGFKEDERNLMTKWL
jgi:ribosomal protein S18 acetylase RimI-like enzyme